MTMSYHYDALTSGERDDVLRLYEKAKQAQWNAATDIDWRHVIDVDHGVLSDERVPIYGTRVWDALDGDRRLALNHDYTSWFLSQILHGEQGALLVASQIAVAIPWTEAKLYAATQANDEARHVEVYHRYLTKLSDKIWPIEPALDQMLTRILNDDRWYFKLIGMQLIFESVAMSAFRVMLKSARDPLLESIVRNVMQDEARHVGFGVRTLAEFLAGEIDPRERDELAEFAFETCGVVAKGFAPNAVYESAGLSPDDVTEAMLKTELRREFLEDIWSVVVPNLMKAGLITPRVLKHFEQVGLTRFA